MKCDEGRPSCVRCISFGATCEGYGTSGQLSRRAAAVYQFIAPQLTRMTGSQIWRGPSSPLFDDDTQGRKYLFVSKLPIYKMHGCCMDAEA